MTRARALKQIIRARAAKTGERYTTARRHVLKSLEVNPPAARAKSAPVPSPPALPSAAPTKGSVSDAMALKKTGHGLEHWFAVLDRFGGIEKGHTASARHLHEDHAVPGWYAQGITVAYERARGARALNQRMSGDYEVSVTKTVTGDTRAVAAAFTGAARRRRWLPAADEELARGLAAALQSSRSKGFNIRADGQGRFRYKWGTTTVQLYLYPKGDGRTSVVVAHMGLPDAGAVDTRRAQWRVALGALATAARA